MRLPCPAVSLRQREIASGHLLTGIVDQGHKRATSLQAAHRRHITALLGVQIARVTAASSSNPA